MPILLCSLDVGALLSLVATAQQQNDPAACARVIDAVAWPPVDSQLPYALADRFTVTEQASLYPVDARLYPRLGLSVPERCKPFREHIGAGGGSIMANLEWHCSLEATTRRAMDSERLG